MCWWRKQLRPYSSVAEVVDAGISFVDSALNLTMDSDRSPLVSRSWLFAWNYLKDKILFTNFSHDLRLFININGILVSK